MFIIIYKYAVVNQLCTFQFYDLYSLQSISACSELDIDKTEIVLILVRNLFSPEKISSSTDF